MASMTPSDWATLVLKDLGAPVSANNLTFMAQWMLSENYANTWDTRNNPLNNGLGSGGGSGLGSYPDLTTAAMYVAQNLLHGDPSFGYGAVVQSLMASAAPSATAHAIIASSWAGGHYNQGANWAGGAQTFSGGPSVPNMSSSDWAALSAAVAAGGGAYLTAMNEQALNAQATGQTSGPTQAAAAGGNAEAIMNAALAQLGPAFNTPEMQTWAKSELTTLAGKGMDTSTIGSQIAIDIQDTQVFKDTYPGIIALRDAHKPAMSVADYQAYTQTVQQAAADAGLPASFMTTQEIGNLVANQISPSEVTQRIKQGYEAAAFASPDVVQMLATYFPQMFPSGLSIEGGGASASGKSSYVNASGQTMSLTGGAQGALAAYFLDPGRAYDVLSNQLSQAQIGAEGMMTGFGQISADQAKQLQQAGFTDTTARDAFKGLNKLTPLENQLPGVPGSNLSQQDLINYGFFGQNQQQLTNVEETRKAPFSGGGGYAQTARGTVGAGYASTQGIQGT